MPHQVLLWTGFSLFILIMMILDLGVFHRKTHEVKFKEALTWVGVWVLLALIFNAGVWYFVGQKEAVQFLAGYLLEQSLSVDNMFVFLLIFKYFRVPKAYQHKVLFWGIVGALVLRLLFIFTGVALINRFHWIMYFFGGFLIFTGFKMMLAGGEAEIHPEKNWVLKLAGRIIPISAYYEEDKFFVRRGGYLNATPMFVVLLIVETTDVLFALDSIPAVLAITTNPFIVFTSNVFAILGLRSLFFALAGLMTLFHYLNYGLSLILIFIGCKMLVAEYFNFHIHEAVALGVLAGILAISIAASLMWPKKEASEDGALLGVEHDAQHPRDTDEARPS